MKAFAIAALAAVMIATGSPVIANTPVVAEPVAVALEARPASTPEYDAFVASFGSTVTAYALNWERLNQCQAWPCYSRSFVRIDSILTQGIQWAYQHPSLPCYQAQQQRATKALQELRGALRMLSLAIQTGSEWRLKVARRKIQAMGLILENLPAHTCPA